MLYDDISKDLPEIIEKYSHLVRSKPKFNPILKNFINEKIINEIINELIIQEHVFLDADNPKKYIRAYFAAKREDAKNKWFGTFYLFREYNNIIAHFYL